MTITLEVNMITRQMVSFFASALWALSVDIYFISAFQELQNLIPMGSAFGLYSSPLNTHLHDNHDIPKPDKIDILFLHKIC